MRIAVAIASRGRPDVLGAVLESLKAQTRPADETWVSVTSPADLPDDVHDTPSRRVVMARPGLTIQRNAIIDGVSSDVDLLVFLDDDAELHPCYLEQAEAFASGHPEVVLFTGKVLLDGAVTGEIDRDTARRALSTATLGSSVTARASAYGCNMVVRRDVADELRFDERLPLYGWLEDRDFSVRAARRGEVVRYDGCLLAHLGYSGGRQTGLRYGVQQTVHPEYLRRKGVLPLSKTVYFIFRALLANLGPVGGRRIDRPGRQRGNLLGLKEIARGDAYPHAVLGLPG